MFLFSGVDVDSLGTTIRGKIAKIKNQDDLIIKLIKQHGNLIKIESFKDIFKELIDSDNEFDESIESWDNWHMEYVLISYFDDNTVF